MNLATIVNCLPSIYSTFPSVLDPFLVRQGMSSPQWTRPATPYHAHFDCFSGAAGDMLLASCLDASERPQELLDYIIDCLIKGIPELDGEFTVEIKQVRRGGMGSIAGLHVKVSSKYHHAPAPVPMPSADCEDIEDLRSQSKSSQTHQHTHNHDLEHRRIRSLDDVDTSHNHSHNHGHEENITHDHSHSHQRSNGSNSNSVGPLRNLPQIRKLLEDAPDEYIPGWVKSTAIATFTVLAQAEAATHGVTGGVDLVHFHEVGAVDSIVDTVGTLLALHCLHVTSISCSRLPIGEGSVWTAHGCLPVPAPATLRLMVGMPTCPGPPGVVTGELVTPTGAALLRTLRFHFPPKVGSSGAKEDPSLRALLEQGRPPNFTPRKIGIGAGTKDFEKHPNILRILLGDNVTAK